MYEIRPESIKTFVEDTSIKLPRFQRKQTWDDKKNFELCISIFKEYPMGVCILNLEKQNGRETKWLLDGRQRRNALLNIWDDPEQIYLWAKKWIGLKNNDQIADVEEKYWEKINEYLEDDALEDNENENQFSDNNQDTESVNDSSSLNFLLEIIKLVHNKTSKFSGFTRPFDFSKIIQSLPYEINNNGKKQLNSKKLKSFIIQYEAHCKDEDIDSELQESFEEFMTNRFDLDNDTKNKLKKQININWKSISERIDIINKIRSILISSKIGLIEVKNIAATDAQKIFNIINSQGTKLNAVEVLSAKPSWNVKINNPTQGQMNASETLYSRIGVKYDNIVKWDLPATIMYRLKNSSVFFKTFTDSKADFEKQLTIGFKIISGIFEHGVKKEDVDALSRNKTINWEDDIDKTINDINLFTKVILSNDYFKYLKSWKGSLMNILSDAIALNFTLIMCEDWKRKDDPIGNNTKAKQFQKNSFVLIDRLIFEYVNRQWRGSSDSKIAQNINDISNETAVFKHIDEQKWIDLLNEIFDSNSIDSVKISQKLVAPILYHFYCISKIQGPDSDYNIEIDHIIPQSLFKQSTLSDKENLQHNIFNLALLPKNENISKSNKRLVEITDQWLKDQIKKYAFIEEGDYNKFSDLNNIEDLKQLRSEIILEAFRTKRNSILNN